MRSGKIFSKGNDRKKLRTNDEMMPSSAGLKQVT